jgi:GNAT superfamily N-acetyltransferase
MGHGELHIRTAQAGDLQSLFELYRHLNESDPKISPEDADRILQRFLSYSGSAIFIGFIDDVLVTSCTLVVIPNLTRGGLPYGLIENVVTDAQHRKRGYGQAILKAAASAAWRSDCYKVMLLTGSKNPATLAFYKAAGFEQSKTGFQIRRAPPREE